MRMKVIFDDTAEGFGAGEQRSMPNFSWGTGEQRQNILGNKGTKNVLGNTGTKHSLREDKKLEKKKT